METVNTKYRALIELVELLRKTTTIEKEKKSKSSLQGSM